MSEISTDQSLQSPEVDRQTGLLASYCLWGALQEERHLNQLDRLRGYADRISDQRVEVQKTGWPWPVDNLDQWSRRFEYPWALSRLQETVGEVLDAGAGINPLDYCLSDSGRLVTICDLDERVRTVTSRLNLVFGSRIVADSASLCELPYEDERFGAVFSISVLEHLDRPDKAIREMGRVLKPGGRLILTLDVEFRRPGGLRNAERLLAEVSSVLGRPSPVMPEITTQTVTAGWHYRHDPERLWFEQSWMNRLRFSFGRIPDLAVLLISGTKCESPRR